MKELLISISFFSIRIGNANETASKFQIDNNWLGFEPAKNEEILITEKRLETILPQDYKEFLKISNGFSAPNTIEPTFLKIQDIDYLKNIDKFIIECYDDIPELENSILIAGKGEEQYFLLIPAQNRDEKWKYWKFANWYPGEYEYLSLSDYFKNTKEFMENKYFQK